MLLHNYILLPNLTNLQYVATVLSIENFFFFVKFEWTQNACKQKRQVILTEAKPVLISPRSPKNAIGCCATPMSPLAMASLDPWQRSNPARKAIPSMFPNWGCTVGSLYWGRNMFRLVSLTSLLSSSYRYIWEDNITKLVKLDLRTKMNSLQKVQPWPWNREELSSTNICSLKQVLVWY